MADTVIQNNNTKPVVDFYFAYLSPYSFLSNLSIQNDLAPFAAKIRYLPVAHRVDGDAPNFHPDRLKYIYSQDVPRYAKKIGINVHKNPILSESYSASAAYLYAVDQGVGDEFNKAVFSARWIDGLDISSADVLENIGNKLGLDSGLLRTAINDTEYHQRLLDIHQMRDELGIFGAPTFVFNGEMFWGNDRISHLIEALDSAGEL